MNNFLRFFSIFLIIVSVIFIAKRFLLAQDDEGDMNFEIQKSEEEWKAELTPEEYNVLREKGTERPHTGEYNLHFEDGSYSCRACGNMLFSSDTKFDSHCGWPSFYDVEKNESIVLIEDRSFGMVRTEVLCAKCGGHLGHVFDDGPKPTGLRYCINSVSISFKKDSTKSDSTD